MYFSFIFITVQFCTYSLVTSMESVNCPGTNGWKYGIGLHYCYCNLVNIGPSLEMYLKNGRMIEGKIVARDANVEGGCSFPNKTIDRFVNLNSNLNIDWQIKVNGSIVGKLIVDIGATIGKNDTKDGQIWRLNRFLIEIRLNGKNEGKLKFIPNKKEIYGKVGSSVLFTNEKIFEKEVNIGNYRKVKLILRQNLQIQPFFLVRYDAAEPLKFDPGEDLILSAALTSKCAKLVYRVILFILSFATICV